ncbi:MAG: FkbM family methyltransferase [Chitinophagales bacterium]
MVKNFVKLILQKLLGFDNYLFIFSIFTINRLQRNWHEKEFVQFMNMIPADGHVLDIGSNIGIMAVPLANRVKSGKVFSFEPMPQNIKALRRIVAHYRLKNIQIFEMALGEETGELKMIMPVINNVKMQGLSHVVDGEKNTEDGIYFSVPVQKLDNIEDLKAIPKIDAIKIDVENFEYYVLKGARELLGRHKPIIYCELWDNEKRKLTMDYLKNDFGYQAKVILDGCLIDYTDQPGSNFLFV